MYNYEDRSLSQNARQNFVKKVYGIISMQLMVTMTMVWLNFYSKAFARFQRDNTWTFWLAFVGSLISLVSLCTPRPTQSSEKSAEPSPSTTP
jgi:FtsH-binding integral membrane protein